MTQKYEVENLLRPPYELLSAATCFTAGAFCALSPQLLLMPPILGYAHAGLFSAYGGYRFLQGRFVARYQRNLKKLPAFQMDASKLPVNQNSLYLGRGFEWKTKHIERLMATMDSRNERYLKKGRAERLGNHLRLKQQVGVDSKLNKLLSQDKPWNPFRPVPDLGGRIPVHGVGMDEERVQYQSLSGREGHTIVVGASGVGKSRTAEIIISQDINRGNNIVFLIDPKGDASLFKRVFTECKRANRLHEFRYLHLAFPEHSCKYNPVGSFSRQTEIPSRLTSGLPDSGDARSFKDFAWQFAGIVTNALIKLGEKPTYKTVKKHLRKVDDLFTRYARRVLEEKGIAVDKSLSEFDDTIVVPKGLKGRDSLAVQLWHLVSKHDIADTILLDLMYMLELDQEYYQKISIQLAPFLEKVTSGKVGELLSPEYSDPNDDRETLDLIEVFKQGGVVYIGLDALTDPEVATAVGEAVFSEMTSLAGYFYNFGVDPSNPFEKVPIRDVCIHGDEFSDLIGPKFSTLINKSRGVGYQLTLYTQTLSDLMAKLESEARAGQILGNISTLIMMRPQEVKTAEILSKRLSEVKVRDHTMVSGYQDSPDSIRFVSSNQDRTTESRVPLISVSEIMALPKGHAFVLSDGNLLRKVRCPLLFDADQPLPDSIGDIVSEMSNQYARSVDWEDLTHGWQV